MEIKEMKKIVKNAYGVQLITVNVGKFDCSLCSEIAKFVVFSSPLDPEFSVCQKCLDNN